MELKEQNITEKRRKAWFIVWAVAFVLLLAGGLYYYLFFYVNREKVQKAWVDVKVVTYYELMQDGKMVLDFNMTQSQPRVISLTYISWLLLGKASSFPTSHHLFGKINISMPTAVWSCSV